MLEKFKDQFLQQPTQDPVEHDPSNDEDFVLNYSICILKYFFLLLDCAWASTANWTGGPGRDIEIDLLQENRNKDLKKQTKLMGANKTNKAIDRSSRVSGGERQIVENYDQQVKRGIHAPSHSYQSSVSDEKKILADLRTLKPFDTIPNRKHESFQEISSEPLATLDEIELAKWLSRHKKNILMDAPFIYDDEDEI